MPYARTSPRSDRFFARLTRFECECPNCGKLVYSAMDRRAHTTRQQALRMRQVKKGPVGPPRLSPKSARLVDATWNPVTQRLMCPWCDHVYMAGLILYPVPHSCRRLLEAPPDVELTARELAQVRAKGGGWHARGVYERGGHVNVAVVSECTCPLKSWSAGCPVHGDHGSRAEDVR